MKNPNSMGNLTVTDLLRLHRIMRRLDALDDAIAATTLQAKPAIRALLREAYFDAGNIFDRGARVFGKHVMAGWSPGIDLDDEFWEPRSSCPASTQAAGAEAESSEAAGGATLAELPGPGEQTASGTDDPHQS